MSKFKNIYNCEFCNGKFSNKKLWKKHEKVCSATKSIRAFFKNFPKEIKNDNMFSCWTGIRNLLKNICVVGNHAIENKISVKVR